MLNTDLNEVSCPADEDYLLRRLGEAVAVLWPRLPPVMQQAILNQAETISYRQDISEVRHQLRDLLESRPPAR